MFERRLFILFVPEWRNGRRGGLKNLYLRMCGFESHLGHQLFPGESHVNIASHIHSNIVIVTGHYGCGKTNLTVNMALALAQSGAEVNVVDLDIVNPYFRISDYTSVLESAGVKMVAPNFAGTTLDTPSLSPQIQTVLAEAANAGTGGESRRIVLVDVGGDPDGATALGRFRATIQAAGYQMLYVVNERRLQTADATETLQLMREIEQVSGLFATHIVGNTHLKSQTTASLVAGSVGYARKVAAEAALPLEFITAPRELAPEVERDLATASEPAANTAPEVFPVDVYVKTPWD